MFDNFFKTAWRNLARNRGYALINIGGLAVGMAVAMLIGLWVHDEVVFNRQYTNYKTIAQVRRYFTDPATGETGGVDNMHYPMAGIMKRDYKQYFKHVVMAWWLSDYTIANGDKKIIRKGEYMDPEGLDMLSVLMLKGNHAALNDLHSVVISRSASKALFGDIDPMNKTITIDNRMHVTVTGVYEDLPESSNFTGVQFFAPWKLWVASNDWIKQAQNGWDNSSFPVFVQLNPGVSMAAANAGIKEFFAKSVPAEVATGMMRYKMKAFLYPMADWHLYSDFKNGLPDGGRIIYVWLFGIVGIFVLLLACINFMNLSTARAEKRAKEVGIRKTMGSSQAGLVRQFLTESLLVVVAAFLLALLMVSLSLPWFNGLADKSMTIPVSQPIFWLLNGAFIVITALLAGAYPAFYLSAFRPVKVLKGTVRLGRFAALPRKALVVIQFSASVILVLGTIIVYRQVQFAANRPVGYSRAGLISVTKNDPNYTSKIDLLRNELLKTNVVTALELVSNPLTEVWNNTSDVTWTGKQPREYSFAQTNVSFGLGKMVGWQFVNGRDFSRDFATDSTAVIINETAAKDLGFTNPVGQFIKTGGGTRTWQIIGVIKDMIMGSPYEAVKRGLYFPDPKNESASVIILKIKPTVSAATAIPRIQAVIQNIVPSALFDYKFVDESYAHKFSQEQRIGKLLTFFAILAIFISCLGLFGLASFVAEQRTREIGIRKVIGASVFSIWHLLSKEFTILVAVALLVASPVANYTMDHWVQKYTYHTSIPWWLFLVVGSGSLVVTLATISFQAIKAALANPVNSLRTE